MSNDADGVKDFVVYEAKVYSTGGYWATTCPEAGPHMINVVDHILKDCAAQGTPEEADRFNNLRRELFRLFPEQKDGYISDPVAAMDERLPKRPSPRHTWDGEAKRWILTARGLSGQAVNPRQSN